MRLQPPTSDLLMPRLLRLKLLQISLLLRLLLSMNSVKPSSLQPLKEVLRLTLSTQQMPMQSLPPRMKLLTA